MTERICSQFNCGRSGKLTRGMCLRCYRYWIDHTPPAEREVAPRFVDNFWQQVEKTHEHGCWLWRGVIDPGGYGRWKNKHLAHRESWKREHGSIEAGMNVLHICDQQACVNPKHLYVGTTRQNAIDASVRGQVPRVNAYKTECPSGHPYAGENLYLAKSGRRSCKECNRGRSRERQRQRRKA
jgi:hypothetical protein